MFKLFYRLTKLRRKSKIPWNNDDPLTRVKIGRTNFYARNVRGQNKTKRVTVDGYKTTFTTGLRIIKAERASFASSKFLKLSTRKTKARLCTAIMKSTLIHGYEAWTTISITERRLRSFGNKLRRIICGPIYEKGSSRRKYSTTGRNGYGVSCQLYIKGQMIRWLGRVMRKSENDIR